MRHDPQRLAHARQEVEQIASRSLALAAKAAQVAKHNRDVSLARRQDGFRILVADRVEHAGEKNWLRLACRAARSCDSRKPPSVVAISSANFTSSLSSSASGAAGPKA